MRKRKKAIECANCHYSFTEINNFCPNCGQENHTHKLPIKHFATELLESLTHFDTKVYRTMKEMTLQPGLVPKNYNNNKRARYVPPIRIYVFMSFIFFFLITILYNYSIHENSDKVQEAFRKDFSATNKSDHYINIGTQTKISAVVFDKFLQEKDLTNEKIENIIKQNNLKTSWLNTRLLHTFIKLYKGETTVIEIYIKLIKYLSYALLVFMPFFALVLKVFYRKKHQYYSEFLVFSLYFHTFIFAILAIVLLLNKFINVGSYLTGGFVIAIIIYLGISLKKVFEESVLKTVLKTSLITLIYLISLLFLIVFLFVSALL